MNEILDMELPVKSPWRRIIFLFLLFAAISLPAIYLLSGNSEKDKKIEMEIPVLPEDIRNDTINLEEKGYYADGYDEKIKEKDSQLSEIRDKKLFNEAAEKKSIPVFSEKEDIKINLQEISSDILSNKKQQAIITVKSPENEKLREINEQKEQSFAAILPLKTSRYFTGTSFLLNPVFDIPVKTPYRSLLNPFAQISIFNTGADGFSPGLGLYDGNSFYFSKRFFLDLSIGFTNVESLIQTTSLTEDNHMERIVDNVINLYQGRENAWPSVSSGVIELSIMEGYHFTRRLSARAGVGVAFTGRLNKIITSRSENIQTGEPEYAVETDLGEQIYISDSGLLPRHAFFAGIGTVYLVHEKLDIVLGFKHYFRNYNVVTDSQKANIYRVSIDSPPFISGIYAGVRYRPW